MNLHLYIFITRRETYDISRAINAVINPIEFLWFHDVYTCLHRVEPLLNLNIQFVVIGSFRDQRGP